MKKIYMKVMKFKYNYKQILIPAPLMAKLNLTLDKQYNIMK